MLGTLQKKQVPFVVTFETEKEVFFGWLETLGIRNPAIEAMLEAENLGIHTDLDNFLKEKFSLPLEPYTKELCSRLLSSSTGIMLRQLGFGREKGWQCKETCAGRLIYVLHVARVQEIEIEEEPKIDYKIKALKTLFNPFVQSFLFGTRRPTTQ